MTGITSDVNVAVKSEVILDDVVLDVVFVVPCVSDVLLLPNPLNDDKCGNKLTIINTINAAIA